MFSFCRMSCGLQRIVGSEIYSYSMNVNCVCPYVCMYISWDSMLHYETACSVTAELLLMHYR
jgi:hypothetical protein